jgi:capsular polysaccharide biosynthesis protein
MDAEKRHGGTFSWCAGGDPMTEQALDLRAFMRTVRQQKAVVIAAIALGVLAGVGYTVANPPLPASQALVEISSAARLIQTEVVIATSQPVLTRAVRHVHPPVTFDALRLHVKASSLTTGIVSITAKGQSGAQAKSAANAVAKSFIDYIGRKDSKVGKLAAEVLSEATQVTQGSFAVQMLLTGAIGLFAGAFIGAIIAVPVARSRRRLRTRDELAAAARAPVLASIAVRPPADAAGWIRLLEDYEASAADAGALLRILQCCGLEMVAPGQLGSDGEHTLMVVSLNSDGRALALGPQLAAFAASRGVPTALVIGPQQDERATETLRAACGTRPNSLPRRSRDVELVVTPDGDDYWIQDAVLVVVVCVVKSSAPQVADLPATSTLFAVSVGAATGEQLARIATRSAASGHRIDGVIVTDFDPADETTGYAPRPGGSASKIQPTRVTG